MYFEFSCRNWLTTRLQIMIVIASLYAVRAAEPRTPLRQAIFPIKIPSLDYGDGCETFGSSFDIDDPDKLDEN